MNKAILLIGGGGHSKSVLDSLLRSGQYNKIGIVDQPELVGETVMGEEIVGSDEDLPKLYANGYKNAFISVGSVGSPALRLKLFNLVKEIGFHIPTIIDPSAIVSEYASIDEGVFIGKNVIVNAEVEIQKGAIINSGAIIEHECLIGKFTHISPGATMAGKVTINNYTHIGLNASLKEGIIVGEQSIIGMGSVVTRDVKSHVVAYGNPSKEMKKNCQYIL